MNKLITTLLLTVTISFSQGDIYPTETHYGGGIGFSTMYMMLDSIPGASILDSLGFNTGDLNSSPLVLQGGEGFAQMSGPWRLGGYAGVGAAQTSNVFDIYLYADRDGKTGYIEPTFGNASTGDTLYAYSEDGESRLSVIARLNFLLGGMTIEYVLPVYRDLELMAGALMGIGRYTLSIDQQIGTPAWGDFGQNMYGYVVGDSVLVPIDSIGRDYDDAANDLILTGISPINIKGSMTELSGTFFNFQPYVAVKWQFLDRMGLRISAGYNKGTIGAGRWKRNGHTPINDSPRSALQGITLRTVIYFGL